MKLFKKSVSILAAATMLTSVAAVGFSTNAAETTVDSRLAAGLPTEVQDGVILHAFNWSYNSIKANLAQIAEAGYTTIQTSPVQQPKDFGASTDTAGQWWKLYQPVSMSIAQNTWLGTKEELTSLCTEAEKYGIKIICDIVSNHMGNQDGNKNVVSDQVKTYQPDFYDNASTYFRNNSFDVSDSSVERTVQGHLTSCPDLNTGNADVQNAVINLLKECIDCGVDGFRFDAAKHIETPSDGNYASDYWKNISEQAKAYYTAKTGGNLYIYGEILNNCGPSSRSYSHYTPYINVTDNRTGDAVLAAVSKHNAKTASKADYKSGVQGENLVLWAESHDTFEGDSGSAGIANTSSISDSDIVKAWAIVGSRKDATALFFARPSAFMGDASSNSTYKNTAVSEINKFHNLCVGESETLGSVDSIAYVVRGNKGIVLANCNGDAANVTITDIGLTDGTYTDTISGNSFTVSGGTLKGSIGSTGVAVVYDGETTPKNTCSVESSSFKGDTIVVELGLENAVSGTYCLDDSRPVTYTGNTAIEIGSDYNYGETINLTLTATDAKGSTSTAVYSYKKEKAEESSGVYIFLNADKKTSWKAPYNIYVYDEDTDSGVTYTNAAAWPGSAMTYDETLGLWYAEVPKRSYSSQTGELCDFDLSTSANTYFIINAVSTGNNQTVQYPGSNVSKSKKPKLNGISKLHANTSATSIEDTTLKPTVKKTDATTVTRYNPDATTSTTPQPGKTYRYGDVNLDGRISVMDATLIQLYLVDLSPLDEVQKVLADTDGNGIIDINDATRIQLFCVDLDGKNVGKDYFVPAPTQAQTTQPVATVPSTTQPQTTQPVETQPAKPLSNTYYLIGYFDGKDYNGNSYKFDSETGKVTVEFSKVSYAYVKDASKNYFMTDGWQGEVDGATMINTKNLGTNADKLWFPEGKVTFTLVENEDGTLDLSYVEE